MTLIYTVTIEIELEEEKPIPEFAIREIQGHLDLALDAALEDVGEKANIGIWAEGSTLSIEGEGDLKELATGHPSR